MTTHHETYTAAPFGPAMMLKALWPTAGWNAKQGFPDHSFIWRNYQVSTELLEILQGLAGRDDAAARRHALILAPHVSGLRLTMAMLMHPSWPLPIWRALQVRNRLIRNADLKLDTPSDLIVQATAWRVSDKGIELEVHAQLIQDDDCPWESVVTFLYRGRYAGPAHHGEACGAPPESPVVDRRIDPVAHWRLDSRQRLRFAALTGDYNPLHLLDAYARRTGFVAASLHPQRILAGCLGHLDIAETPHQLDVWLKGPVYYGRDVELRRVPSAEGDDFALWVDGDERPAMVGTIR